MTKVQSAVIEIRFNQPVHKYYVDSICDMLRGKSLETIIWMDPSNIKYVVRISTGKPEVNP